jgi:hypothetical protein
MTGHTVVVRALVGLACAYPQTLTGFIAFYCVAISLGLGMSESNKVTVRISC